MEPSPSRCTWDDASVACLMEFVDKYGTNWKKIERHWQELGEHEPRTAKQVFVFLLNSLSLLMVVQLENKYYTISRGFNKVALQNYKEHLSTVVSMAIGSAMDSQVGRMIAEGVLTPKRRRDQIPSSTESPPDSFDTTGTFIKTSFRRIYLLIQGHSTTPDAIAKRRKMERERRESIEPHHEVSLFRGLQHVYYLRKYEQEHPTPIFFPKENKLEFALKATNDVPPDSLAAKAGWVYPGVGVGAGAGVSEWDSPPHERYII